MDLKCTTRGWYLLRANATSEMLVVTIIDKEATRKRRFNANLLPGRRLRTYVWCEEGEISVNKQSSIISLTKVSTLSVHAKAVYRLFRYSDFSLVKKVQWSLKSLQLTGKKLETLFSIVRIKKQLFANLDELNQPKNAKLSKITILESYKSKRALLKQLDSVPDNDWIVFAFSSLTIHPNSAACLSHYTRQNPQATIVYSHHFNSEGVCFIKPQYNLACATSYEFILPAVFIKAQVAREFIIQYDEITPIGLQQWLLTAQQVPERIDEFLVQSDYVQGDPNSSSQAYFTSLIKVARDQVYGEADSLIGQPKVSIIIPTYNGYELLKKCIDGLNNNTTYADIDIIVVNNNSNDAVAISYLSELQNSGITVLDYPHPFNYSAINNYAVKHATGEYLCFLNNDIEVISKDWLESMMYWATRESVGAVGARLLYPDGRLQHAGLVVGMGGAAGHLHRFEDNPIKKGYSGSILNAAVATEVSAVTAACLVVKRELFERVNGFDQDNLAIAYNDVDFCLKISNLGFKNIYCAEAQLYHHESVSRGDDLAPDKIERYLKELQFFQQKWKTKTFKDSTFSSHLHLHIESQPKLLTNRRFD